MMKEEFEKLIGKTINQSDYELIDFVYTFHPSIKDVGGKDQIAHLYQDYGMRIIKDMIPTATEGRNLSDKIIALKSQLNRTEKEYEDLKSGN